MRRFIDFSLQNPPLQKCTVGFWHFVTISVVRTLALPGRPNKLRSMVRIKKTLCQLLPAGIILAVAMTPIDSPAFAESSLETCLELSPNSSDKAELAVVVQICTEALSTVDSKPSERIDMLINRGVALRNLGALDRSLSDLTEAVSLDGKNTIAIKMKAWTLREMGRPSEALEHYDLVIRLELDAQSLLSRCVVQIDMKLFQAALPDCERAMALDRSTDSLYFMAYILFTDGRNAEALQYAIEALRSKDALPQHYVLVAKIQEQLGHIEDAVSTAREAKRLYPGDSGVDALLRRHSSQ